MKVVVLTSQISSVNLHTFYTKVIKETYNLLTSHVDIVDISSEYKSYYNYIADLSIGKKKVYSKMENLYNYNIIHITTTPLFSDKIISFLEKKYRNSKIIFTMHDPIPHSYKGIKKYIRRHLCLRMNRNIANISEKSKNVYVHIHSKSIVPDWLRNNKKNIYAEHPLPNFENLNNNKKKSEIICFSFIGSNSFYKGLDIFINALKYLETTLQDNLMNKIKVVIAGNNVKDNYESFDLINIQYLDKFLDENEFITLISNSDVLVFPYRDATQSGVLVNALALGKACIVTNVGALPELIKDNVTGIIIPKEDYLCLANAIKRILDNSILLETFNHNVINVINYNKKIANKFLT